MSALHALNAVLRLMRPHQWLKNAFVFAGLVFSQSWTQAHMVQRVLLAFVSFCCISSFVYIVNDWHDRASDALHPVKRHRPLANGKLSGTVAAVLALVLMCLGVGLAYGNTPLLLLLGLYVGLNLAYSWRLKHVPVVDVSLIASGFMLRLFAGTWAVGIAPSRWLLLTGMFVALFLGFSKRRAESFRDHASKRSVLSLYPDALLDMLMAVTLAALLMTYSLFASSPEAQLQHGERLLYTIPIVIFATLRYAYQVHQGRGEDVAHDLLHDPWTLGAALVWAAIFLSPHWL